MTIREIITKLENEIKELKDKVASLEKEKKEISREYNSLKRFIVGIIGDDCKDIIEDFDEDKRIKELKECIESLKADKSKLEDEVSTLKKSLDEVTEQFNKQTEEILAAKAKRSRKKKDVELI